jgi:Winged helix DNA-binding domain
MDRMVMLRVSRAQAVNYRLLVNNLSSRLAAGSYVEAAYAGLQDSGPRDALVGMHARVRACEASAWQDSRLVQTYSPRAAVYLLPAADFGVFTVGRLPRDPQARQVLEDLAEKACRALNGQEVRGTALPVRGACATGRIAVRWTTSALYVREHDRPSIDPEMARIELCRRHVHAFGPTTPTAFAWWAGVQARDARKSFDLIADELVPVDLAGHRAWVLAADESTVRSAEPMRGVRLLAAPDLRLFGQDRTRLFVGPGNNDHSPMQDWFHPHGLVIDGRIAGAWGRRGGQVNIRAAGPLTPSDRRAIRAEAMSMPIPDRSITVFLTEP